MNGMANVTKCALKQANKYLYRSEGEADEAFKEKQGHKKQVSKARIIPGIPEGETTDTLELNVLFKRLQRGCGPIYNFTLV